MTNYARRIPTLLLLAPTRQHISAAPICGDLALTSTRLSDGLVTVEVARSSTTVGGALDY
jgi:hypothetical protein